MILTAPLQIAQYRLARHYLNKLRTADQALRRGQASAAYGRTLFVQEWEQIKLWQAWAAQREGEDEISAQLCKDFTLAGLEVLAIHTSSVDYALWLEHGLEAAQRLHDDQAERALCYELAMTNYRLGLLENVEHLANQLLALGEAAQDCLSIERAVLLLGLFADERGSYVEAERHYQRALQLSTELNLDSEAVRALNGLGAVAVYRGDYLKAYPYFVRQLELLQAAGTKSGICHALIALGRVLIGLKKYNQAEAYLQRAVRLCRTHGFQRLLGVGLLNLGSAALKQNQPELARSYLLEGIQMARATSTQRQIIRGLTMLGDTQFRLGDSAGAFAHLQEGLQMAREAGLPRLICDLQLHLANTYLAIHDLKSAHAALIESLTLAQHMGSHPQKVEAVSIAAAYFQGLGQPEQAARWLGTIIDDPELDAALTKPVYAHLEAALGSEAYRQTLEIGKTLNLDRVVAEIIELLAPIAEG